MKKNDKKTVPVALILIGLMFSLTGFGVINLDLGAVSGGPTQSFGAQLKSDYDRVYLNRDVSVGVHTVNSGLLYKSSPSSSRTNCINDRPQNLQMNLEIQYIGSCKSNCFSVDGQSFNTRWTKSGSEPIWSYSQCIPKKQASGHYSIVEEQPLQGFSGGSTAAMWFGSRIKGLKEGKLVFKVTYLVDGKAPDKYPGSESYTLIIYDSSPSCSNSGYLDSNNKIIKSCDCTGSGVMQSSGYCVNNKYVSGKCSTSSTGLIFNSHQMKCVCEQGFELKTFSDGQRCISIAGGGGGGGAGGSSDPTPQPTDTPPGTICSLMNFRNGACTNANDLTCLNDKVFMCMDLGNVNCWVNSGKNCAPVNDGGDDGGAVTNDNVCDEEENCMNSPEDCGCGDLTCNTDGMCVQSGDGDNFIPDCDKERCLDMETSELTCKDSCGSNEVNFCELNPDDVKCKTTINCDSNDDCGDEAICFESECVNVCQKDSDCGGKERCFDGVCKVERSDGSGNGDLNTIVGVLGILMMGGGAFMLVPKNKKSKSKSKKRR